MSGGVGPAPQVQGLTQPQPSSSGATASTMVKPNQTIPVSQQNRPSSQVAPSPQNNLQPFKPSPLNQKRVEALLNINNILLREVAIAKFNESRDKTKSAQSSGQNANTSGGIKSPTTTAQSSTPTASSPNGTNPYDSNAASTTPTSAGQTPVPTSTTPTSANPTPKPVSRTTVIDHFSRVIQTYIAYLLAISQQRPLPPHPSSMEPPPESWIDAVGEDQGVMQGQIFSKEVRWEAIKDAYRLLKELWPNYVPGSRPHMGQGALSGQAAQSQQFQQMQRMQQMQQAAAAQGNTQLQAQIKARMQALGKAQAQSQAQVQAEMRARAQAQGQGQPQQPLPGQVSPAQNPAQSQF